MRAPLATLVTLGLATVWPAALAFAGAGQEAVDYVLVPPAATPSRRAAGVAHVLYLNRCAGGCEVQSGDNDPHQNRSSIIRKPAVLPAFSFGDAAWTSLVQCVRHAYALYDLSIVTEPPPANVDHVAVLVAGRPTDLGFGLGTLGVAPLSVDCSPQRNVLAFAFADSHPAENLNELCSTVVHEAGHTFGLDHALQCRDPMTYLTACGGQAFLNIESRCGEFRKDRHCRCSDVQNSHVKLTNELGPSGVLALAGTVSLADTPTWDGSVLTGQVDEPRWIRSIELWINGFRWGRLPHTALSDFLFTAPPVSNGILDIEVRSVNDLGAAAAHKLTLTKGAPCQTSATCRDPEVCQEGRCMYPAPTGPLGAVCTEPQDCASWECFDYSGAPRCSMVCSPGLERSECPAGYTCVSSKDPAPGMCWPTEELPSGGCSSAAPTSGPAWLLVLLGLLGLLAPLGSRRR
ncbi:MAG: hypothetical protein IPI49_09325 [Myxococcales bacterium]|nr:hypothetical protein [Myxococcales bacterium]